MSYCEPKLTPRQREAVQQGLLPFMLRFGGRAWIRVGEAANEFRLSPKFFYERLDLDVFEKIAAGKSYVLSTRSVLLWALVNSNFDHAGHEEILRDYVLDGVG